MIEDHSHMRMALETRKMNGFEKMAASPFCEDKMKNKYGATSINNNGEHVSSTGINSMNGNTTGIYKVKRQIDRTNEISKTNIIKKLFA
jgi:hypothetical protein